MESKFCFVAECTGEVFVESPPVDEFGELSRRGERRATRDGGEQPGGGLTLGGDFARPRCS